MIFDKTKEKETLKIAFLKNPMEQGQPCSFYLSKKLNKSFFATFFILLIFKLSAAEKSRVALDCFSNAPLFYIIGNDLRLAFAK